MCLPTCYCANKLVAYFVTQTLRSEKLFCNKTKVKSDFIFLFQIDIRHTHFQQFHICKKTHFYQRNNSYNTLVTSLGELFRFHNRVRAFCSKKKKDHVYFACRNTHCGSRFETPCLLLTVCHLKLIFGSNRRM